MQVAHGIARRNNIQLRNAEAMLRKHVCRVLGMCFYSSNFKHTPLEGSGTIDTRYEIRQDACKSLSLYGSLTAVDNPAT